MGIERPDDKMTKWGRKYREWLRKLELSKLDKEVLCERLAHLEYLESRMTEITNGTGDIIKERDAIVEVGKLISLKGIGIVSAATLWSEAFDFKRFGSARAYMGYS